MRAMNCPGCHEPMVAETLDGHLGRSVAIDLCLGCQLFWFDQGESLQLAPRSTLRLFRLIGEQAAAKRGAIAAGAGLPALRVAAGRDPRQAAEHALPVLALRPPATVA